ncbi:MAG: RDD family protein [Moraxella sp.]|nr:RDD family protein [Moraxella sp.]
MQIYLARDNVQAGPYGLDELNTMLTSGEVALSDLMWHAGMDNWQAVGEMTKGQYHYTPNVSSPPTQAADSQTVNNQANHTPASFGDNVDFRKKDETRRVSVAELYGKKPVDDSKSTDKQSTPNTHTNQRTPNTQNNTTEPAPWMGRHRTKAQNAELATLPKDTVYASVMTRFLATAINMVLLVLSFVPFVQSLAKLGADSEKMNTGDFAARMAYAQELATKIDPMSANITMMLIVGLLVVQVLLIVRRGQSLGKLATGIRIVDERTGRIPDAGVLLGLRGALLAVIYWLASVFPFSLNLILLGVNYFMASSNPKKQGWHDRLAKTMVVKAHPAQLDKSNAK